MQQEHDPFQVRYIEVEERSPYSSGDYLGRVSCGDFVAVAFPKDEETGRERLGIFIGSVPVKIGISYDEERAALSLQKELYTPLIFLPHERIAVLGYECTWERIDTAKQLSRCCGEGSECDPWCIAAAENIEGAE